MDGGGPSVPLSGDVRDRVLARLGLEAAPFPDLGGLRAVYRAWCSSVPFENTRKMIALRTGPDGPLPGGHGEDFFTSWLVHGTGGTCWPTSNALFELLRSLGFEARRVAGSMRDTGDVSHASVKVRVLGGDWLVDSSMLTNVPLPLGDRLHVESHPVFPAEVEPVDGTHVVWTDFPPNSSYLPCRLLVDPASHALYLDRYERSRERSPFNQRLYARRNLPGELVVLVGGTRFSKTADGLRTRELSPDELCREMRETIGLSADHVEAWARTGALEASFEPPSGPKPPPIGVPPPSKR